jgi:hypothetical protein
MTEVFSVMSFDRVIYSCNYPQNNLDYSITPERPSYLFSSKPLLPQGNLCSNFLFTMN